MASSQPAPLVISSFRGGVNNTDPAIALAPDQCTDLANIEWIASTLGERRRGTTPIDLTASGLTAESQIPWAFRHLPTNDETQAELWAWAATGTATSTLARKDTSWHGVAVSDAIDLASLTQWQISAVSLHGKLFLAYNSAVNRLHVWDGTTLRRVGLPGPGNAPTAANAGGGTLTGTRYYRVRWTVQSAGVTLRRSEPSTVLTFAPSGAGASITVTRPTDDSEGATHWELEASTDNSNFYRVATTVIGTTTYSDSAPYVPGYAAFPLSPDLLDYALLGSARYLLVDEDRLVTLGNYEDPTLDSRVTWTPVNGDPGSGNDERVETDTDPFLDLDGFEGGRLVGGGGPVNGCLYAFKRSHIYRLVRTGNREAAYQAITMTKSRGALEGSITPGLDEAGRPALYFWDPQVGPCRMGADGLQWLGADIYTTTKTVNLNATTLVCRTLYYPQARQVHFWLATGSANIPNLRLVLHTDLTTPDNQGNVRRGWSIWTGNAAAALAACLFADNVDAGVARNFTLRPVTAVANGLHRGDTGTDDSGTAFAAYMVSRPYTPASILNRFGVMAAALLAKAAAGVSVSVTGTRDFGVETLARTVPLDPAAAETLVIKPLDSFSFAELKALQITLADTGTPGRWELYQLALKPRPEQTA